MDSSAKRKIIRSGMLAGMLAPAFFGIYGGYLYWQNREALGLLRAVQARSYAPDYQCLDFSRDLSRRLREEGIPNSIAIVNDGTPGSYHAVVSVQIEPQTGGLADYPLVDLCREEQGSLLCRSGIFRGDKLYVASPKPAF